MSSAAPRPTVKEQRADPHRDDQLSERKEQRADKRQQERLASTQLSAEECGCGAPRKAAGRGDSGRLDLAAAKATPAAAAATARVRGGGDGDGGGKDSSSESESACTTPPTVAAYCHSPVLARYTQRPSPVTVPPHSISNLTARFFSADECATLIELIKGDLRRSVTNGVDSQRGR